MTVSTSFHPENQQGAIRTTAATVGPIVTAAHQKITDLGIVVIGRNEGPRLSACLGNVAQQSCPVVYVDSGSTDDSLAIAQQLVVETHVLDPTTPYSAARARNEGLAWLLEQNPDLATVQFVDGDCVLDMDWIQAGWRYLQTHKDVAAVCGRLHERHRTASIYHRLCDLEWDAPAGDTPFCGGIAMMRVAALQQVGGFDPDLIAGEEPDLCVRLRRHGWRICRLSAPMATHEAAITRFAQWWRRMVRAGYCFAQLTRRYRHTPLSPFMRQSRSAWFWGCALPAVAVAMAWPTGGLSLILPAAGYLLLATQIGRRTRKQGPSRIDAALYAAMCVVAKFPQVFGQMRFHLHRLHGTQSTLIEYKTASCRASPDAAPSIEPP